MSDDPKRKEEDRQRRINEDQRRDVQEWIRKEQPDRGLPEITDYFREKPPKKEKD